MRILLITAILGAGALLTGCVPFIVDRHHSTETRNHRRDGRDSQRDDRYRDGYNGTHDRQRQ